MMANTYKRLIAGLLLAVGLHSTQALAYIKCDGKWVSIGAYDYCIPNNVAPSVGNQALTMNENTTGYLGINVTDPDAGDTHKLSVVSGSPYGSASFSGSTLIFTPNAYWYGTTQVTFQAVDSKNAVSNVGTVTITVNHVNIAPTVTNKTLTINENTSGSVAIDVTDQNPGDSYRLAVVSSPNGTATFSGRTLTFTPNAYWHGSTQVTYRAYDSKNAASNIGILQVTVKHVNIAPTVSNKTLHMDENATGSIVIDVTDPNPGDSHTLSVVSPSPHGSATFSGKTLSFESDPYWHGDTQLTYQAVDSKGAVSNVATVMIKVKHVNIPPTVTNAALTIDEDTSGSVVVAVTDPNPGDTYALTVVSAPNGTASFSGDRLTFKPNPDWNGTAKVTYRAIDSKNAESNLGALEVTVIPVNDKPVGIQYEQF